jgi:sec-independent protein translocase protein TatC
MSFFDHLEELRIRIFYGLIAVVAGAAGCFAFVKPIVAFLEVPAEGISFQQLNVGEFFFVSLKVAGYCGVLIAMPVIIYQVVAFILPGLTKGERRLVTPVLLGSGIFFFAGLAFCYVALLPAALNFFLNYGADVVELRLSIASYFEFLFGLMLCTGLAFQVPIVQLILGFFRLVSSKQMVQAWRPVMLTAFILGAVLTPSTDPVTQSLLSGAVLSLYFLGIGFTKFIGR